MELKCATKKAKTYDTEDEVFKHWNYDCEAFFFYCPNCSTPFRNKEHNCVEDLKQEKEDVEVALHLIKDQLKEYRENEGLVKIINPLEDHNKMECEDFYDTIYKKLVQKDKDNVLEWIADEIEY